MAQQFISLIKFRRGTHDSRNGVHFQEGEPLFETDRQRFLIGTGNTDNNVVVGGNVIFIGELSENAYNGDLSYTDNFLKVKNGEEWTTITASPDEDTLIFRDNDNKLMINPEAIKIEAGSGINVNNRLVSIKNSNEFNFNNNRELVINNNAITANKLNQNVADNSTIILSGNLKVKYNPSQFSITASGLTLHSVPAGNYGDINLTDNSGTVNAIINDRLTNTSSFEIGIDGTINLPKAIQKNSNTLKVSEKPKVIGANLGISAIARVDQASNIYNGTLEVGKGPGLYASSTVTIYPTKEGTTTGGGLSLSDISYEAKSAGMLILDNGIGESADGRKYKKFAIPVYEVPGDPIVYAAAANTDSENAINALYGRNLQCGTLYVARDDSPVEEHRSMAFTPLSILGTSEISLSAFDNTFGYITIPGLSNIIDILDKGYYNTPSGSDYLGDNNLYNNSSLINAIGVLTYRSTAKLQYRIICAKDSDAIIGASLSASAKFIGKETPISILLQNKGNIDITGLSYIDFETTSAQITTDDILEYITISSSEAVGAVYNIAADMVVKVNSPIF